MFRITKTFGHEQGFTVAFRQWAASETHCSKLHGYPLAFTFVIEGSELDHRNWLFSFGDFKEIKEYLTRNYDHTTLVARDDPEYLWFKAGHQKGVLNMNPVDTVGCEAIAEQLYKRFSQYVQQRSDGRARLVSVEVREHGANGASYGE